MKNVLITGGAGFIGSHLTDKLLDKGYNVRVLDNLNPQVHGGIDHRPQYLNEQAEFIKGDVRDKSILQKVLKGIDAVFHFAAMVGVGQSMYEIKEYMEVNSVGTSTLLELLIKNPVEKLVVASSMSIYGEGLYRNSRGEIREGLNRNHSQFKKGDWEVYDENGEVLLPYPTTENKTPSLSSIYALSKYDQERMCIMVGKAYNMNVSALRFFNVYGTRQSLSNPYTGVLAIFASRLLNDNPPLIFEDGNQQRDFVNVHDIARACTVLLESKNAENEVLNIGSGVPIKIKDIAYKMAALLNKGFIHPEITGKYRVGDIRHCFADISKAENIIGFAPEISFEEGLLELTEWLQEQKAEDKVLEAKDQLAVRGLTV